MPISEAGLVRREIDGLHVLEDAGERLPGRQDRVAVGIFGTGATLARGQDGGVGIGDRHRVVDPPRRERTHRAEVVEAGGPGISAFIGSGRVAQLDEDVSRYFVAHEGDGVCPDVNSDRDRRLVD